MHHAVERLSRVGDLLHNPGDIGFDRHIGLGHDHMSACIFQLCNGP